MNDYKTLKLEIIDNNIAHVIINRPEKANAMNQDFWIEIKDCANYIDKTPKLRVAIISGAGNYFSAGVDLEFLMQLSGLCQDECEARTREKLRQLIIELQSSFTALEKCRKPIIAAIHGGCIGAGVDMITACDMRFCTADAYFSIKEIDMGITADVGTLQRLPHIIGDGIMRELAYTGRKVPGIEAKKIGLVNRAFATKEEMQQEVISLAKTIAAKSPLTIRGVKEIINYSRDHSTSDSLNYVAAWNAGVLLSNDIQEAITAHMEKRSPVFKD